MGHFLCAKAQLFNNLPTWETYIWKDESVCCSQSQSSLALSSEQSILPYGLVSEKVLITLLQEVHCISVFYWQYYLKLRATDT